MRHLCMVHLLHQASLYVHITQPEIHYNTVLTFYTSKSAPHFCHDQHLMLRIPLKDHLLSMHAEDKWILTKRKPPTVDYKKVNNKNLFDTTQVTKAFII